MMSMTRTSMLSYLAVFFAILQLVGLVSAVPAPLKRDVFVPPILYPRAGTIWKVGEVHNVTWSLDNVPSQITNKLGRVVLATGGLEDVDHPLAENFSILLGRVEVTVPAVASRNDYAIVLFGDSGNFSPNFTITN